MAGPGCPSPVAGISWSSGRRGYVWSDHPRVSLAWPVSGRQRCIWDCKWVGGWICVCACMQHVYLCMFGGFLQAVVAMYFNFAAHCNVTQAWQHQQRQSQPRYVSEESFCSLWRRLSAHVQFGSACNCLLTSAQDHLLTWLCLRCSLQARAHWTAGQPHPWRVSGVPCRPGACVAGRLRWCAQVLLVEYLQGHGER